MKIELFFVFNKNFHLHKFGYKPSFGMWFASSPFNNYTDAGLDKAISDANLFALRARADIHHIVVMNGVIVYSTLGGKRK